MIANSLLLTVVLLLVLGFWLMDQLRFLIPYKFVLYHRYGTVILAWAAVLFLNVFAAVYALHRKFFLKDTGQKLSHLDKQVIVGDSAVPRPMPDEERK